MEERITRLYRAATLAQKRFELALAQLNVAIAEHLAESNAAPVMDLDVKGDLTVKPSAECRR